MLIKKPADIRYSEITPKHIYMNRRNFLAGLPAAFLGARELLSPSRQALGGTKLPNVQKSKYTVDEKQNSYQDVSTYNNYYEFGTDKSEPSQYAKNFKTEPWTVSVEGECAKPRKFTMDEILALAPLEERIYRHRCVEGWSIVVPWVGYSLSALLKQGRADVQSEIRRVRDLLRPQADAARAPGSSSLTSKACGWTKPCTRWRCCASACTAKPCPPQDGAPVRIDPAVEVRVQEHQVDRQDPAGRQQPSTSWNLANPPEYGFYSNVNPHVDHPRWSQAIGAALGRIPEASHPDVQRLRRPGGQPV